MTPEASDVRKVLERLYPGARILDEPMVSYDGLVADTLPPDEFEAAADFAVERDYGHLLVLLPKQDHDHTAEILRQVADNHARVKVVHNATAETVERQIAAAEG